MNVSSHTIINTILKKLFISDVTEFILQKKRFGRVFFIFQKHNKLPSFNSDNYFLLLNKKVDLIKLELDGDKNLQIVIRGKERNLFRSRYKRKRRRRGERYQDHSKTKKKFLISYQIKEKRIKYIIFIVELISYEYKLYNKQTY